MSLEWKFRIEEGHTKKLIYSDLTYNRKQCSQYTQVKTFNLWTTRTNSDQTQVYLSPMMKDSSTQ